MESEGLLALLRDPHHWGFEIVVNLVLDGIFLAIVWPWLKRGIYRHLHRDLEVVRKGQQPHVPDLKNDLQLVETARSAGTRLAKPAKRKVRPCSQCGTRSGFIRQGGRP